MKGILEKKEEGWFVRWSDLHSFTHGTHWMWTPLHQTEVVDETKYKDGDEVEFEMVITGYDKENFTPFSYAKLSKQNKLIMIHQIKTNHMKKLVLLVSIIGLTSCVNQMDRLQDAQKKYPKCIVQPTTSILARQGYEIMVEDTINNQIYVLHYYMGSSTKIWDIRNIK
jgi:hypothetical protein